MLKCLFWFMFFVFWFAVSAVVQFIGWLTTLICGCNCFDVLFKCDIYCWMLCCKKNDRKDLNPSYREDRAQPEHHSKDQSFPAEHSSLQIQKFQNECEWISASALCESKPGDPIFLNPIDFMDIKQGSLGDCWLLAAMVCLCEFPELIENLFVTKQIPENGRYKIKLFNTNSNEWQEIEIDDLIPCNKSTKYPLFADIKNGQIWPALLEKCWAKYMKNYRQLNGGFTSFAVRSMTGRKVSVFYRSFGTWKTYNVTYDAANGKMDRQQSDEYPACNDHQFFNRLLKFDEDGALMSAADTTLSVFGVRLIDLPSCNGIVKDHAYTLLQVKEVENIQLLQLRNPWREFEWNGDWSDRSSKWNQHPEIKRVLKPEDKQDGKFWIAYEDFLDIFNLIDVCFRE